MRDASQVEPQLRRPPAGRSARRRRRASSLALVPLLCGLLLPATGRADPVSVACASRAAQDGGARSVLDLPRLRLDDLALAARGTAPAARRISVTSRPAHSGANDTGLRDGSGGLHVVAPASCLRLGVPAPAAEAGRPEDERLPRPPDLDTRHRPPGGAAQ